MFPYSNHIPSIILLSKNRTSLFAERMDGWEVELGGGREAVQKTSRANVRAEPELTIKAKSEEALVRTV